MNSDSFFSIGKTHSICQDYSEHGDGFVVLSDGCSTAKDSQIGAMLLCRCARRLIEVGLFKNDAVTACKVAARDALHLSRLLRLPVESTYATLGAVQLDGDSFRAVLFGDGVVASRIRGTGTWDVRAHEFMSGAPFYPAYDLDETTKAEYQRQFGMVGIYGDARKMPFVWSFPKAEYDAVAVMSDGSSSFMQAIVGPISKRTEKVSVRDVLTEVLNFKNFNGQFVQRRCKAAMKRFAEEGIANIDDFSIGVVYDGS